MLNLTKGLSMGRFQGSILFCFIKLCRFLCLALSFPFYLLDLVGLRRAYRRLFPLLVHNITSSYNNKMHKAKRELFRNLASFANADGSLRLLEIGCGSGANLKFYPHGCTVTCTDPNPHFERYLRMSMDDNKHLTYETFLTVSGEDMRDIQDGSVDVVVSTLVLCSVRDVPKVLQEVRRVLRTVSFILLPSRTVGFYLFFLMHVFTRGTRAEHYLLHLLYLPVWQDWSHHKGI